MADEAPRSTCRVTTRMPSELECQKHRARHPGSTLVLIMTEHIDYYEPAVSADPPANGHTSEPTS